MSFILDALKKSEAERARQAGPALLEMRIARPRQRIAPWIMVLALLLLGNLALLLWFALRRESAAPANVAKTPAASLAVTSASAAAPAAATGPAGMAPSGTSAAAPGAGDPALAGRTALPPPGAFVADPGARIAGANDANYPTVDNPADLEPAAGPAPGSVSIARSTGTRPNYSEVDGSVPELRLDLHVYASRPQERYALINMHKVHEGDLLPEGPRVLEITRDGVVLDWHGGEFMLGRE
jgi:general secretion pathway protein B